MKIKEAETQIHIEWNQWSKKEDKDSSLIGLTFYNYLEKNRPDLLNFRCRGDKYQRINSWVNRWQRS